MARAKRTSAKKKKAKKRKSPPGLPLELAVARIQQMFDPNSTVTHDEKLRDRVGNIRQYDVVFRGHFAGQPAIGVIECKDHSRKKGPDAVEAFSKKTEHLGANFKMMVSRKGFTKQALSLAEHDHIVCLSLAPDDPKLTGFSIGQFWYGLICSWTKMQLTVHLAGDIILPDVFSTSRVLYQGKPVIHWFMRELFTKRLQDTQKGQVCIELPFAQPQILEIEGVEYLATAVSCIALGKYQKKSHWVYWTGDAFYDWHAKRLQVPAKANLVTSAVPSDLSEWPDFDGEIPSMEDPVPDNHIRFVCNAFSRWDDTLPVPDLMSLCST